MITNVQNVNRLEYYGKGSGGAQLLTTYSATAALTVVRDSFDTMTFSWYPGQGHNNIKVYVSNDGVNFGSSIWNGNGNTFQEATFALQTAQYIRITADYAGGGALNDVHVFQSIPEPASLALLALGGLAALRRRSPRA